MTEAADRRPIAARELPFFKKLASSLAKGRVSANAISVAGAISGIVAGAALASTGRWPELARAGWLAGAAFVQLRLIANMLDGMVAIESGTASKVGELYNEVPDRVSDTAILLGLGWAAGGHVVWGFAAALAAMMTAYVRTTGKGAGAPHDFCGPMAKQHRMAIVTAVSMFCALVPASWRTLALAERSWGVPELALIVITVGAIVTSIRRLLRIGARLRGSA